MSRRDIIAPVGQAKKKIGSDNRAADGDLLSREELQAEIARVRPLMALQEKLWNRQMVRHEFLGSYRRQRATYDDGTTVSIDLDENTYTITAAAKEQGETGI